MAIGSRPKPKVQHRKRKAQHHQRTTAYLRPYWPYLPMLAIVGLGVLINDHWPDSLSSLSSNVALPGKTTRIEAMVGSQNSLGLTIIVVMAAIAATVLVARHWFRIKRTLNRGERFIVKHPLIDILLVATCTIGILLTRSI